MKNNEIEDIFEKKGLRPSPVKTLVFRTLEENRFPMSVQQIEQRLDTVDRSSITRAVGALCKAGLLHVIQDGSGSSKFERCLAQDNHSVSDEHVHFHCRECGRTICLSEEPVPEVHVPEGFTVESVNYVISGRCDRCSSLLSDLAEE